MDVERELRAFFEEEAERAFLPGDIYGQVVRRSRPKRVLTATLAGAMTALLLFGGVLGSRALLTTWTPRPAEPGQTIPSFSPPPDLRVIGEPVVLSGGTVDGKAWQLVAYRSDAGLCVDLQMDDGAVGGCGSGVPEDRDLSLSQGHLAGLDKTILHGEVSKRVASLEVRLDDGPTIDVDIIPDPEEFGVHFFVAFLPTDSRGFLVAKGEDGEVLQTKRFEPIERRPEEALTEEVIDEYKITVYYPRGWNRAHEALAPEVPSGREVFSVGTYPLAPGAIDCYDLPERAMEALGPQDAFVTLQEIPPPSSSVFPPRPDRFSKETGDVTKQVGCLSNAERLTQTGGFRKFAFRERGRFFISYVLLGEAVSASTRQQAWDILNNFLVCDPASNEGDCL